MATGIIGGTGVYDSQAFGETIIEQVETPYGVACVYRGQINQETIYFINRHGSDHKVPPHLVNYRANLWALAELGVKQIIATGAVGSLNPSMKPGDYVLVDQFIDFTKSRAQTFYDGGPAGVVHVDVTEPYCPQIKSVISRCAADEKLTVHQQGTYVVTEGPRFETPAEIQMYARLGGDLVGMTSVPEVVLARELGICYATIGMVTNFAAGITGEPLTQEEVLEIMDLNSQSVKKLITNTVRDFCFSPDACRCGQGVAGPIHQLIAGSNHAD